jgi:site-specific DNA recombinase
MRCAIYTRVSTDEQAESEYSSLDTQREICEHYVQVQREKGWQVVEVYEDAGFSGKDLERPAIHRLLADARQGKLDVVVTYKLDRISRSLRDFYGFWEVLKQHGVTFVSATQNFDTSDSAGNLMLNILLSFAQYERELTMERTATKMKARAQKGKWNGGWVPLGYDYVAGDQLLVPNPEERKVVETVFDLVIAHRSLSKVRRELSALGHRTKVRTIAAPDGQQRQVGGNRFSYDAIKSVVENPVYKGLVRHQDQLYPGEHEPLITEKVWAEANAALGRYKPRRKMVGRTPKDDHIHLLKGLLKCGDCGSTMTPYPAGKKGPEGQPYLYYTCTQVIERGKECKCRVRSLPARRFEQAVKDALAELASRRAILEECVRQANVEADARLAPLRDRQDKLTGELSRLTKEIRRLIEVFKTADRVPADLKRECVELDEQKQRVQTELEKVQIEMGRTTQQVLDLDIIQRSLQDFGRLVTALPPEDQKELMQLLVDEIVVQPFDPRTDEAPAEEGAFTTQIRTKHYLVNIRMHQIADLERCIGQVAQSSDNEAVGSPARIRTRNPLVNSQALYR